MTHDFWASIASAQELLWVEFRPAWLSALCAGLSLPIVGCHAHFRRQTAAVLAVPQASFAAMAVALAVPAWSLDSAGEPILFNMFAAACVGAGVGLAFAPRGRRSASAVSMLGLWIVATAIIEVARSLSPVGDTRLEPLLHGEVLGITPWKAGLTVLLPALALSVIFRHHQFMAMTAFPETSAALGRSRTTDHVAWSLILGVTITLGTTTLGPVLTAGLLLIPSWLALTNAQSVASTMRDAAFTGVIGVLIGSLAAVLFDLPLGGAVLLGALTVGGILGIIRIRHIRTGRRAW